MVSSAVSKVLAATPRMRQISIASPVQKDADDVNRQGCQQCATHRHVQEQPDTQQSRELRFTAQSLQQSGLGSGELQQLLRIRARSHLRQRLYQCALVGVGHHVRALRRSAEEKCGLIATAQLLPEITATEVRATGSLGQ